VLYLLHLRWELIEVFCSDLSILSCPAEDRERGLSLLTVKLLKLNDGAYLSTEVFRLSEVSTEEPLSESRLREIVKPFSRCVNEHSPEPPVGLQDPVSQAGGCHGVQR